MSNLSNRPQNKNFGQRAGRIQGARLRNQNEKQYHLNSKSCKHCNKQLTYDSRHNTFCSQSCSAKYNNSLREREFLTPVGIRPYCKVTFIQCPTCNNYFRMSGNRRKYCSFTCNPNFYTKKSYRTQCKFKLNPKDHPTLYNSKLINQHGWYNPTNRKGDTNLDGVCWDHLFRIEEGYKNQISPEIISHPANAELVPWRTNISRKVSQITYEKLLERIDQWEAGISDLPTFYSN